MAEISERKKNILLRRIIIAISLFLTASILGLIIGIKIDNNSNNNDVDKIEKILKEQWYSEVYYEDASDEDAIIAQFISSIINLDYSKQLDPYTYIIKNTSNEVINRGQIGITVSPYFNYPVITNVNQTGPSYGILKENDIIYGLGHQENEDIVYHYISENEYNYSSIFEFALNHPNQDIYIKLARFEGTTLNTYEYCINSASSITEQDAYVLDYGIDDTLCVKLTGFVEPYTYSQFKSILDKNEKSATKAHNIVIDLRNNGGGSLTSVANICDLFLKKNQLITTLSLKDGSTSKTYTTDDDEYTFDKYYILINESTASASEVMVKCLSYYFPDLKLIGTTTYGKGIAQKTVPINKDYSLKLTFAKWLAPDNSWIENRKGINPSNEECRLEKDDTLNLLETLTARLSFADDMKLDSVSNNNIYLSNILKKLYDYDIRTDGYFDAQFEDCIKDFQTNMGLTPTGLIDETTYFYVIKQLIDYKGQYNQRFIDKIGEYNHG